MQTNFKSLSDLTSALIKANVEFKFEQGAIIIAFLQKTNIKMATCTRGQIELLGKDYKELAEPFVKF